MFPFPCTAWCDQLAILLLLLSGGCVDYSKLSSKDMAGAADLRSADKVDLAGDDLAGDDLRGIFDPPDMSGTKPDMTMSTGADMAEPCVGTLSNIGAANFVIRFHITTTANVASTVLYQRSGCGDPLQDYWDINMSVTGQLGIAMGNGNPSTGGSNETALNSPTAINDGATHDIVFSRTNETLSVAVDGAAPVVGPTDGAIAAFHTLPALGVTSGDPCGYATLVGTVTNICLQ